MDLNWGLMAVGSTRKRLAVLCAASAGALAFPRPATADFLTDWNNQELARIRTTSTDPLYASRDLAILQVAMFDAINGVEREDAGFYVTQDAPAGTSLGAAIAAVGFRVMTSLHGSNSAFTTLYNSQIASLTDSPTAISQGVTWGTSVADTILSLRTSDGASSSNPPYSASGAQGDWAPTPPAFATQPLRPGWDAVAPFALITASQFRPNGPPSLDSLTYTTDFNQVKSLGQDVSSTRGTDSTNIAHFWNDPSGTVTTAGHWNQALQLLTTELTTHEKAKVFAAVNIAMADSAIAAWDGKYTYKNWRPVTAIRDEATRDAGVEYDNPNLTGDAAWTPLFSTPVSPEYLSLTSVLSQAAATTLANLLGGDLHSFSLDADTDGDGVWDMTRSYTSFSQASIEAGRSGIYAGNQFNSSLVDGRVLGENVGQYVSNNFFTPVVTTTDNGATLFSLTLSDGTLSPVFAGSTTNYTAIVTGVTASITVTPTAMHPQATIAVNGTPVNSGTATGAISLAMGSNLITVLVTAPDGIATTTYTLDVIRALAPTATTLTASNITGTTATLSGTVNANGVSTTAVFDYGLTTDYGNVATAIQSPLTGVIDALATVSLSGLLPGSTYHYRVRGVSAGGTGVGAGATFATPSTIATLSSLLLSAGALNPAFAGATTDYSVAVSHATTSLTIAPTATHPLATITVNGSPVTSSTATDPINLNLGSNVIIVEVTAQDGATTMTYAINVNRLFPAPVVTTLGASGVTGTSAILSGSVNAIGYTAAVTFDYGPTADYGSSATATPSLVTGSDVTAVSAALTGLAPGTVYHYRVKGDNQGAISLGEDATFTTPSSTATLSSLVPSAGTLSPDFASATTGYAVTVPNATDAISFTPVTTQPAATLTVNGIAVSSGAASGDISLNVGGNVITVLVTAQDGVTTKTYTINVTRSQPAPEIVVEQPATEGLEDGISHVAFGNAGVGSTSSALVFTIRNAGTADLTGLAVTIEGADAAEFATAGLGAVTLAPNTSTTFQATFSPTVPGTRSAVIHIASNDADENPFEIAVSGAGIASRIVAGTTEGQPTWNRPDQNGSSAPVALSSSATSVPYEAVSFNVGAAGIYTLTSTATSPLGWDNYLFLYANGFNAAAPLADVLIGNDNNPGVGVSGFSINLQPGTTYYAVTTGFANSDAGACSLLISGPGGINVGAEIAVEQAAGVELVDGEASVSFGVANVGSTSNVLTFTIRNPGTTDLSGLAVSIDGDNAADFTAGSLGGTTLGPGASTTFSVTFNPADPGPATAAIHIASNDTDESPFDIDLSGSGVLATTAGASGINSGGVTLNGIASPYGKPTTAYFQYGTNSTYGLSTTVVDVGSGTSSQSITFDISGLNPGTTYHYRTVVTNPDGAFYGEDQTFTTLTLAAQITSPPDGSTLPGNVLDLSWTSGTGAGGYIVWVGSAYGGFDLGAVDAGTNTSCSVTVPQDGGPVYVTLWSLINGGYQGNNYWFTTALPASGDRQARITNPANSSTLGSTTLNLIWDAGVGASSYALWVGSTPDGYDLYAGAEGTNLSKSVTIPGDGRRVHVALHSLINGSWQSNSYWFTSPYLPDGGAAQVTNPVAGSTLVGTSLPLTWTAAPGATQYCLFVGSNPGGYDYYAAIEGSNLARTVTVPADGRAVHVTLYSCINGVWKASRTRFNAASAASAQSRPRIIAPSNGPALARLMTNAASGRPASQALPVFEGGDYQSNPAWFSAPTLADGGAAHVTSPPAGSTLASTMLLLRWDAAAGATQYYLLVGSSPGAFDFYRGSEGTSLARTVIVPADGRAVYVTLCSRINGEWQQSRAWFAAANTATGPKRALITSPANGATLSGASTTFNWGGGTKEVTGYELWIGSSPGAYDLWASTEVAAATSRVVTLPTDGREIYVTLNSLIAGSRQGASYVYKAANIDPVKAVVTSPADGSTLSGALTTFTWNPGKGVTQYYLFIGRTPGGSEFYVGDQGASHSRAVTTLPTDGSQVHVTLYSRINGVWQASAHVYQAAQGG